jgi:DHA1 family tetracycline resistance protein-like MFS transporter
MTQRVPANEQGELQGAIGVLRSSAMLVGPSIFSLIFSASIAPEHQTKFPGAPWYVAALILFVSLLVANRATNQSAQKAAAVLTT